MVVDRNRARGAQYLADQCKVDIVVSDDGLQHFRMARNIEIVVIDGERRFGNRRLLPAGPLRESMKRLASVDFVVANGGVPLSGEYGMRTEISVVVNLRTGEKRKLDQFKQANIVAVAGIGHPDRFFSDLRCAGLAPQTRRFPDHHHYKPIGSLRPARDYGFYDCQGCNKV